MCPLPAIFGSFAPPGGTPSVTQTFPSLSTCMPCGKMNMPAPKLLTRFPFSSNLRTTGRDEPAQEFAPHRSATQMDLPSGAISTALVDPQFLPSGIFAHPSTVRYGLGRSFIGWSFCVSTGPIDMDNAASVTTDKASNIRTERDMANPPQKERLYLVSNDDLR